jgi:hypothetical protein
MAVTIVRTPWIDDDGTGTTGTVVNNAVKTALYNDIDGALAKVAQLTGGNTLTGNQTIAGLLTAIGIGTHVFQGTGAGIEAVQVRNATAGGGNLAALYLGNDTDATLTSFLSLSSTFTSGGSALANGTVFSNNGLGGLSLATNVAAAIRIYTNNVERLRVQPTGEVCVNQTGAPTFGAKFAVTADGAANPGMAVTNSNPGNTMGYAVFFNSAAGIAGQIQQTGATTVAYTTTSDARLKDDAGRAADLSALRAVVVHDFAWKADGRADRGVFAQDAHAVFPRAVTVGTDDTTADGTLTRPWMTDYSKFVPDLIVGWQHHDADLAELRALLVTLKGSADAE